MESYMMNISQIFEEHGTNIILLDSDLGTTFDIVKIDEETFELREMFTSYIEDCLPEETKENYILKIADVNDLERFACTKFAISSVLNSLKEFNHD